MFGIGKKKKTAAPEELDPSIKPEDDETNSEQHLADGLGKTRNKLTGGLANLFLGKKEISQDLIDDLENHLLTSDVGLEATEYFIAELKKYVGRKETSDPDVVLSKLKAVMATMLQDAEAPLNTEGHSPYVIMMIGVNGAGKTTTTGKLTKRLQLEGKHVMLAAADTFRAAAVEQLQVWGERNNVAVVAQKSGADSAAVSFDAVQSAKAKNMDVLVVDTAGRLHTQDHLMEELKKVKRVMSKVDEGAPHEVMLVLDASIGQNALQQAKLFHEAIGVTSLCITKLDGTAKGGIIFAIVKELGLPIRFVGVGEAIEDLQVFNADRFVNALWD